MRTEVVGRIIEVDPETPNYVSSRVSAIVAQVERQYNADIVSVSVMRVPGHEYTYEVFVAYRSRDVVVQVPA